MEAIFPIEKANAIVEGFLSQTLHKAEWTHEAHLLVGLYHLVYYGKDAMRIMSENIKNYNLSVGTLNTETSGYHTTLTYFWLWAVEHYCQKDGLVYFNQETIDDLLWTEELANRNLWLDFYTKENMMSVEARLNLCEPDIKKLNS